MQWNCRGTMYLLRVASFYNNKDRDNTATVTEATTDAQVAHQTTFSGSSVAGMQSSDVIIWEVWFSFTSSNAANDLGSLGHTVDNLQDKMFDEDEDDIPGEIKNSLHKHLEKAMNLFQRKEHNYYDEVINHLYNFAAEVDKMESEGRLSQFNANLLRP